jgi:predicted nucleic acid-binding protein
MSSWVVDTSSLIFLAHLDRLDLLQRSADLILIPPAVLQEVRAKSDVQTSRIEAAHRTWLRLEAPKDQRVLELLLLDLDAGEAEAVALAYERSADRIVMDDLAGRRYARRLGLPLVGTLGLLLAARLRGEIKSLKSEVDRLRAAGFYANEALVARILGAAGE